MAIDFKDKHGNDLLLNDFIKYKSRRYGVTKARIIGMYHELTYRGAISSIKVQVQERRGGIVTICRLRTVEKILTNAA